MRRPLMLLCAPLCALALAACGSTVSTSNFKGTKQQAAQALANLQADATAGEQKKICADDLAASVVARLGGTKGCEAAIKAQLAEVDSLELSVHSIKLTGPTSATAQVKGIYQGKGRFSTLALVKEGKVWKVSGL